MTAALVVIGAVLGAYGATVYWQRELYFVRRMADRDLYEAQRNSSYWYARAADADWKLAAAYDVILARDIRTRRSLDVPADRTSAIGSSTRS